ncbi:uncharacterized protein [Miscanthus floridulus]|uniref:uncharacterized protein n=1 Tax=Miscanthus floridulus TaxID=154761 RepID=UPI003457CDF3
MLLAHFTAEHRWPSARFSYARSFSVDVPPVQEAAHVVVVLSGEDDDGRLFLLDVAPAAPLGCVVSVFRVRPRQTKFQCEVNNSFHIQSLEFQVPSTTLADGIPWERDCSMSVLVPKFCLEKDGKIRVTMNKVI